MADKGAILIIEDEATHRDAMVERLRADGFGVEAYEYTAIGDYTTYLARHPENRIVVVDMHLKKGGATGRIAGWSLIQNVLWPLNRNAAFVLYTGEPSSLQRLKSIFELSPPIIALKKETIGDALGAPLTDESLSALVSAINETSRTLSVDLAVSPYNAHAVLRVLDRFEAQFGSTQMSGAAYREVVAESIRVLNAVAQHAQTIGSAGQPSRSLAAFVFGSCGRLEMRPDSDVELSILRAEHKGLGDHTRNIAPLMWNRVALGIPKATGYNFEGATKWPDGLPEDYSELDLGEGYRPIISANDFSLTKGKIPAPHRNRYFQIITEAQPVFNEELLKEFKWRLLLNLAPKLKLGRELSSTSTVDVVAQWERDTVPPRFDGSSDAKQLTYRYLNVLAFRLGLIYLDCIKEWHESVAGRDWLLDFLAAPGPIKCMEVACYYGNDESEVTSNLKELVDLYLRVLELFHTKYGRLDVEPEQLADSTDADMHEAMRRQIKHLVKQFAATFESMRAARVVKPSSASFDFSDPAGLAARAEAI